MLLREIRARLRRQLKIVQRFCGVRPATELPPIVRFETPPGQQLQIDFVVFRRGPSPLRAFTAELGYSRYPYVEFTDNERTETLLACLEALHWFDGVPKHVLCDNPKTIVIERNAYGKGKHRYNSKLLDFAKHCGFEINSVRRTVRRPRAKSNDSIGICVNRSSTRCRPSTPPVDVALANREVMPWLRDIAGKRIHATLKERPVDRFATNAKT